MKYFILFISFINVGFAQSQKSSSIINVNYSIAPTSTRRIGPTELTKPPVIESEGIHELCKLSHQARVKEVKLKGVKPEYFFKTIMPTSPSDKRNEISIIISGVGNAILDMTTGNISNIPGAFDAVPSIDGEIITLPAHGKTSDRFTIYQRDDLTQPIYQERDDDPGKLTGVYQSVGLVNTDSSGKSYRVITDVLTSSNSNGDTSELTGKNLLFRDYKITENKKVVPIQGTQSLCSNVEESLKLPMLSKNGKKLAAYNDNSGTTVIYKILKNENNESVCEKEMDLGFSSTKVEFSEDSNLITFASDSFGVNHREIRWHARPNAKNMNMNVYVMDLRNKKTKKISAINSGNAYYPSFSRDQTVTYLQQMISGEETTYSVVQSSYSLDDAEEFTPYFFDQVKCNNQSFDLPAYALGKLWFKVCNQVNKAPTELAAKQTAITLDPSKCKMLVENYWEQFQSDTSNEKIISRDVGKMTQQKKKLFQEDIFQLMRALKVEDLLSVCPKNEVEPASVERVDLRAENLKTDSDILSARCSACHVAGTGRLFIVGDDASMKKYKSLAIQHVQKGYMPLGVTLTIGEQNELLQALLTL